MRACQIVPMARLILGAGVGVALSAASCGAPAQEPRALPEPTERPLTEVRPEADAGIRTAPPPRYGNRVARKRDAGAADATPMR